MSDILAFVPPWKGYLKGLIYYLNVNEYERLHDLINVTPSSTYYEWDTADNIIDFFREHDEEANMTDGNWASDHEENSSVIIDFRDHHIISTHYTIRSRPGTINNTPHEWIVEGSNDGENWTLLHHQPYNNIFQSKIGIMHTFKMSYNGVFSKFKITQLGTSCNGSYHFHLSRFELFGTISLINQSCYIPLSAQTCIQNIYNGRFFIPLAFVFIFL